LLPQSAWPKLELEYFHLFFTYDLLNEIVFAAIQYIAEKIQKATPPPKFSVWHAWLDVTLEELKAFPGVVINMVLNSKAELVDYFSEKWLDRTLLPKCCFLIRGFFSYFGRWILYLPWQHQEVSILKAVKKRMSMRI
jgi:hypothetical protein